MNHKRTVFHEGKAIKLVGYCIITKKITDKFFEMYKALSGRQDLICHIPSWFYFEGPEDRADIPEEFEIYCNGIVGPTHYNKMLLLYQDIKRFMENRHRTLEQAREIHRKMLDVDYWFKS